MSVSIVFLNYNRIYETRTTVEKILLCRKALTDLEIIAVDNCSTDGTGEYLSGVDGIIAVLLNKNYGIEGYNKGFELATGDIIIVLDDDSHIEVDTIRRVMALFEREQKIGIAAFRILDKNGIRFKTWHIPDNDIFQDSFAFVGCGFAIRKELFKEIGFYPAGFFLYHNEIYVALNVKLKGYRVVYDPQCVAIHRTEGHPRDPSRRVFYTLRNSLILIWMYYPWPEALYLTVSRLIISCALALAHLKPVAAIKALSDFLSHIPLRQTLSRQQRQLLKPFFYQNSIFHRLALLQLCKKKNRAV